MPAEAYDRQANIAAAPIFRGPHSSPLEAHAGESHRDKAIPAKLYVGTRAEAAFFLEGLTQLKLPGLRLVLPK